MSTPTGRAGYSMPATQYLRQALSPESRAMMDSIKQAAIAAGAVISGDEIDCTNIDYSSIETRILAHMQELK